MKASSLLEVLPFFVVAGPFFFFNLSISSTSSFSVEEKKINQSTYF
jgi:hypothetical protein